MWNRALMRLLSLSFMSLFVIGLLWDRAGRGGEASEHKPMPGKSKEISCDPAIDHLPADASPFST
jgi:hypothetical protein